MKKVILIFLMLNAVLASNAQSFKIERNQGTSSFNSTNRTALPTDFSIMFKNQLNKIDFSTDFSAQHPYSDELHREFKESTIQYNASKASQKTKEKENSNGNKGKWQFGGNDFKNKADADSCWNDSATYKVPVGISLFGWGSPSQFQGHWVGVYAGFVNNLKSRAYSLNLSSVNILISSKHHIGFYSGLGFTYYDYYFETNSAIHSNKASQSIKPTNGTNGYRFAFQYLTVPFMVEKQCRNRCYYSIGGMLNVLSDDQSQMPLNNYNAAILLKGGYRFVSLSANYNFTPLMNSSQASQSNIFSVTVGITF